MPLQAMARCLEIYRTCCSSLYTDRRYASQTHDEDIYRALYLANDCKTTGSGKPPV